MADATSHADATPMTVTIPRTDVAAAPDPITITYNPDEVAVSSPFLDPGPGRRRPDAKTKAKKKAARKQAKASKRRNRR